MKVSAYILGLILSMGMLFMSCERDDDDYSFKERFAIDTTRVFVDDQFENRLKDSLWYYYKYLSLWEPIISPATTDLNKMDSVDYLKNNYTQYFQTAGDVLGYLMYLTKASVVGKSVKANSGSGNSFYFYRDILFTHKSGESKAYDWYSFLDRGGFITGAVLEGYISGFGMDLMYVHAGSNDTNPNLFVKFVEKQSSAYQAGLRRGHQIISLDGDTKIDFITQKATNFNTLNNYLNSSKLVVAYKTPQGENRSTNLQYKVNSYADPVFVDTVLIDANKNVGYVGISSFLSTDAWVIDKTAGKSFKTRLSETFDKFSSRSISELVVDLRYNGGGSVTTAEYLGDVLVPSSASGQLKVRYKINSILQSLGWDEEGDEFAPVKFSKSGNLNLSKIYFLVSEETASASELLINMLSPYMKVYLIGTYKVNDGKSIATNTYGKPVGFFPWDIVSSNNQLYVTSFQMFNKDGFGDYFDGLKPDTHVWEYDKFKNFGERDESMLAAALYHIKAGVFKKTQSRSVVEAFSFERKYAKDDFGQRKIQGMYKFPSKKNRF